MSSESIAKAGASWFVRLLSVACNAAAFLPLSAQLDSRQDWTASARSVPLGSAKPSSGCTYGGGASTWGGKGGTAYEGWVPITVMDFVPVNRSFWIQVPDGVGQPKGDPVPLLLALHGQGGTADGAASSHDFGSLGSLLSFVTVFPQGIDDAVPGGQDLGTGWNVGTAGDEQTCIPDIVGIFADCYASCRARGRCGDCNWSGCFDDVLFIKSIIAAVSSALCIDESRVYVTGESNGGMLAHYLVQEMPGRFAAFVPWFGLPLLGYAMGAEFQLLRYMASSRQTAMLQLHGRQDAIMPIAGGVSGGALPGWIYEPLNKVQQGWAAVHECDTQAMPVSTYWDGGDRNLSCSGYQGCSTGRKIMRCLYDGAHGDRPGQGAADQITMWFLLQFRIDTSLSATIV